MIEYRYLADTPKDGVQELSWPTSFATPGLLAQHEARAKKRYGKKATVRVEQREVSEWVPVPAELEQEPLFP